MFVCINTTPKADVVTRLYNMLERGAAGMPVYNNKNIMSTIYKGNEPTAFYGNLDNVLKMRQGYFKFSDLGIINETPHDDATLWSILNWGRISDMRSPHFLLTVFDNGTVVAFTPKLQGNVTTIPSDTVVTARFDNAPNAQDFNITKLSGNNNKAYAWDALKSFIVFQTEKEYKHGDCVSFEGRILYVVGKEYMPKQGGVMVIPTYTAVAAVIEDIKIEDAPEAALFGSGAIIEQGTNSNGTYIRWDTGLQIVWGGTGSFYGNMDTVIYQKFPKDFITFPKLLSLQYYSNDNGNTYQTGSYARQMNVNNLTFYGFNFRLASSEPGSVSPRYCFIGFWR